MLAITHQISHPEVIHTLGDSAMSPIFVFRRPLWDRLLVGHNSVAENNSYRNSIIQKEIS